MNECGAPGFYGKLPSLGDFVSRRLPQTFIDPWDAWLQAAMAASREQLGEQWLDVYLTSPLWRFALSPGVSGDGGRLGVVMPSVDRVGRYFPLAVVTELPTGVTAFAALAGCESWMLRVEKQLLDVLEHDRIELDDFDASVAQLGSPDLLAGPATIPPSGPGALRMALPAPPAGAAQALADVMAAWIIGAYSIWWTSGSERVEPSCLVCEGLPPTMGFGAMLGGGWSAWGWHDASASGDAPASAGAGV